MNTFTVTLELTFQADDEAEARAYGETMISEAVDAYAAAGSVLRVELNDPDAPPTPEQAEFVRLLEDRD